MTEETHTKPEQPEESRLARWSRRKAAQRTLDVAPSEAVPVEIEASTPTEASLNETSMADAEPLEAADLPVLTDADMPPVSSLNAESDFSGFLSPGVSEELRKLALRKMFSLPSFKARDGLDDYDDDFTVFEPLGDTVTNDPWTTRQKRLAEEREAAESEQSEMKSAEQRQAERERERADEDQALVDEESVETADTGLDATGETTEIQREDKPKEQDSTENE
ncbi:MAG: DUF3306 domain-containing protein [Granulosicoccaceae bacterium]